MKKIRILSLSFVFFIFLSFFVFGQGKDTLKIHFIDVGEGDAILIEAPDGETALVDAGNLISGYCVVEYLKKRNIQNLDYLIFTHHHLDHIGGAFFVLQMMDVKKVYDNGDDLTEVAKSSDMYRWYEKLVRQNKDYKILKAGDILYLGEVTLKVLWPQQLLPFSGFNANSLVIVVKYGEFRCLLTGDATTGVEKELIRQVIDLKADILKVGHHGADDATCKEFLMRVSPKIAVISINEANIRGYPAKEIVDMIEGMGIRLYRTDKDGNIVLDISQSEEMEPMIEIEKSKR